MRENIGGDEPNGGETTAVLDSVILAEPQPEDLLAERWSALDGEDRLQLFEGLNRVDAGEFFLSLAVADQAALILDLPASERRIWLRLLPPDDAADVIQHSPDDEREALVSLLDVVARSEVQALLLYADDDAGGKMNPRYARLRPEMTAAEAIAYLRRQGDRRTDLTYYVYVLDQTEHLLGIVAFRDLIGAPLDRPIRDVMQRDVAAVREDMDQEEVATIFRRHALLALPVVDAEGRMKGIVTADDVIEVLQEEATEDIQKLGGVEALDLPYFHTRLPTLIRKRGGWLTMLFLGGMLTTAVIGVFQHELERAVVLTLFIPLVISSGGNSGSQASTLIIRAMALGEVRLSDAWRVLRRELFSGLALGAILAVLGVARILGWEAVFGDYGDTYWRVAMTLAVSLVGVVVWGTLIGSMLPFALRRARLDPAMASAPLVATLSDVTGLVIYFTAAKFILLGAL
ncbi:MAG: magnesium transporter [Dehalococcoidia bacterium]|nr:magnesium transporter [Dehalococcoidia bacterium]